MKKTIVLCDHMYGCFFLLFFGIIVVSVWWGAGFAAGENSRKVVNPWYEGKNATTPYLDSYNDAWGLGYKLYMSSIVFCVFGFCAQFKSHELLHKLMVSKLAEDANGGVERQIHQDPQNERNVEQNQPDADLENPKPPEWINQ